jgi:Arc/MetJ-type ribon-helix-helix transcriptional regulator
MKSAVIPQVRVEPELRAELEAALRQGETLSDFVEASVRSAVEFRRVQTRFHERGQAAWEHYQNTGLSVSAEEALDKLQTKLDAKRKQLGG